MAIGLLPAMKVLWTKLESFEKGDGHLDRGIVEVPCSEATFPYSGISEALASNSRILFK